MVYEVLVQVGVRGVMIWLKDLSPVEYRTQVFEVA